MRRRGAQPHLAAAGLEERFLVRSPGPRCSRPFEEDGLLSLIISKAVMLAADDRITDPTILRQLR